MNLVLVLLILLLLFGAEALLYVGPMREADLGGACSHPDCVDLIRKPASCSAIR